MTEGALAELLGRHAAAYGVPGAALGVLRAGRRWAAYSGVADVRSGSPVGPATRFGIGSLTKSMTASAVAVLDAAGVVSLDDVVAAHARELARSPWAETATLRDLLANRSRVPLRASLEFGFDAHTEDDDRALARLVEEAAGGGQAADRWSYANIGWCVLGRVIETATGAAWHDAMPRLLAPAGLRETTWTTASVAERAVGHDSSPAGPVPVDPLVSRAYSPAGATITSTVDDLLRYAAWHLAEPALESLRETHEEIRLPDWLDAWCLGWARFDWEDGVVAWGWDGLLNGQRAMLRMMPDHGGAVVVLTNGSAGRALARSVLHEVVPEFFGVRIPTLGLEPSDSAPQRLAPYAGSYGWPDRRVEVTASERSLLVTEDGVTQEGVPLDRSTFLVDRDDPDAPTITFADFDGAGRPGVLYDLFWGLGRLPDRP